MDSNEYTLKEAINKLLETYRLKGKLSEVNIIERWETMMGKMIAKHTTNIYLKDRKLFLTIDSAPLRHELTFAKEKIIEILNREMGEEVIEEVVIR